MKRDVIDPAPLWVGGEYRHLALAVQFGQLAVIAAHDDAHPVGRRTEDAAAMDGHTRDTALGVHQGNALLGADKGGAVTEKMNRRDRRADRDRTHAVGDGSDGGLIARFEVAHHEVIQLSKPSRMICSGNSQPIKTSRLSRSSPSFHFR